ncbi:hypothetical protein B296_00022505 [Ensete ventricosum]|uniref:Uncharacterized protein n=1 Tax=Ensete ventricosum TaxID=4639 RepID=A0A427AIY0_ENSVE|nr:hypothetical protein B296_00022505 [Ensete ventricosum]
MRYPGQLIPFSTKAIFLSHISAAGESDSAEYDSCDSPLEPNSPLYGLSDKVEAAGSGISNLIALYRRSVRFDFNHCRPLPGGINLVTARLAATREEARKKKEKEGEPRTTPPSNDEASPKAGDVYD